MRIADILPKVQKNYALIVSNLQKLLDTEPEWEHPGNWWRAEVDDDRHHTIVVLEGHVPVHVLPGMLAQNSRREVLNELYDDTYNNANGMTMVDEEYVDNSDTQSLFEYHAILEQLTPEDAEILDDIIYAAIERSLLDHDRMVDVVTNTKYVIRLMLSRFTSYGPPGLSFDAVDRLEADIQSLYDARRPYRHNFRWGMLFAPVVNKINALIKRAKKIRNTEQLYHAVTKGYIHPLAPMPSWADLPSNVPGVISADKLHMIVRTSAGVSFHPSEDTIELFFRPDVVEALEPFQEQWEDVLFDND